MKRANYLVLVRFVQGGWVRGAPVSPRKRQSMKATKPTQHALPHDTTYSLIRTYHTGGLENGVGCQNCGKVLTNVAEVENAGGQRYLVGLDCAATLATVNPFEFNAAAESFNLGKKVRAAILKYGKKFGNEFTLEVYEFVNRDGQVEVSLNGLRTRADESRDRYFTYYMTPDHYLAVVKPMGGDSLPERPQTAAEQLAEQEARRLAYEAKHGTLAERLEALRTERAVRELGNAA